MTFKTFLLFIPVLQAQAFWQIKWRDEFYNKSIDLTKWEVTNEDVFCDGNHNQQLNCKTNNSRNLWLTDGTLAIAAVAERDKYLDHDFTSAMITTKQEFTYGKFEMRAALPKGKMLRPAIYFMPTKPGAQWPKDGQIIWLTYTQTQKLGSGIFSILQFEGTEYPALVDLQQFHSYAVEWNQSTIIWKFDEIEYLAINLTDRFAKSDSPFNSPFKLGITLGVGGQFFSGLLNKDDEQSWYCSLLILDYIRIYEWIEGKSHKLDLVEEKNRTSGPEAICETVMPLIRLQKKKDFPFTAVVSALSLILLLALIPFVIYMFIRQKKLRINQRNSEQEYYEDTQADCVYYEDVKENEYADPYQTINTNHYTTETNSNRGSMKTSPEDYIQITNKYINKEESTQLY